MINLSTIEQEALALVLRKLLTAGNIDQLRLTDEQSDALHRLNDRLVNPTTDDSPPLWRTERYTPEEQNDLAAAFIEEIQDSVKSLAHEQLDEITDTAELDAMFVDLDLLDEIFKTSSEAPFNTDWPKFAEEAKQVEQLERLGYVEHVIEGGVNKLPGYQVTEAGKALLDRYL